MTVPEFYSDLTLLFANYDQGCPYCTSRNSCKSCFMSTGGNCVNPLWVRAHHSNPVLYIIQDPRYLEAETFLRTHYPELFI